ncbi:tautomerase family protein [Arthrobacter sp.]|uniref:tautomerase family protein n=1 Tax=Arthrobacter sp. TaxID=1667 RepID=UPI00339A6FED
MPIITVQCRPKSVEQRRQLSKDLTEVVARVFDVPLDAVQVFINEADDTHWAKGGVMAGG